MASKRLSYKTIEDLWIKAGGDPKKAPVMAAIAIAESGGRTTALNDTPPDYSVGLWQINYYGSMRAGRTREFGSPSALMASPAAQARAAVAIERQQGLTAWSTYSSGAYRRYLNGADYTGGGTDTSGGGGSTDATQALFSTDKPADCLVGFPIGVGYVCLLTKGQARAVAGGLLLAAGGIVSGAGLLILAAYGLRKSGALDAAASAAAVIPGAGPLAAKAAGASSRLKSGGEGARQRQAAKQAASEKQAAEQRRAAEKRAAAHKRAAEKAAAAQKKAGGKKPAEGEAS